MGQYLVYLTKTPTIDIIKKIIRYTNDLYISTNIGTGNYVELPTSLYSLFTDPNYRLLSSPIESLRVSELEFIGMLYGIISVYHNPGRSDILVGIRDNSTDSDFMLYDITEDVILDD